MSEVAETLLDAALRHHQDGRLAEAEALYRQMLAADPAQPDALLLLATLAHQTGRRDLARQLSTAAIPVAPDSAAFHANLGRLLRWLGDADAALPHWRRASELAPEDAEAQRALGSVLKLQGNREAAITCFRRAIELRPDLAEAHHALGTVFHETEQLEAAAECYRQALAASPGYPDALINLSLVLRRQGRLEESIACCRAALAANSALELAHFHLAEALREQEQWAEAIASYRQALALNPEREVAHHNLAATHLRLGQTAEAIACLRNAIRLRPDFPEAHNNLGMALLSVGELPEGWREHEWRWRVAPIAETWREFAQPRWEGEAAPGRMLLVHAEQGFGDALQFCRFAPLARSRGLRVVVEAPAPLVRLLHGLRGVDAVVASGESLPPFDLHCPMLSLPLALGTTLRTIPSDVPYLFADSGEAAAWRAKLAPDDAAGPRIGVCWAGSPRSSWPAAAAIDRRRSIALELLAPLFALPGLQWFSLQKTGPAASPDLPLIDHMAAMHDFADTAALIANLDLVVSVDTAIAHLAGAMGKPVWLLDRFDHCWRWLAGRRDSPWYPMMRIYRQPTPGAWELAVAELAADLARLAEAWQAWQSNTQARA